jgi:hypothetical protein
LAVGQLAKFNPNTLEGIPLSPKPSPMPVSSPSGESSASPLVRASTEPVTNESDQ